MSKYNRLSVEDLKDQYTREQLIRIFRYQTANNPVTNVDDFDEILEMDDNDYRLFEKLHLPKTNRAIVVKSKNKSNQFRAKAYKCPCDGLCNITDISKNLTLQLQTIQDMISNPIHVTTGYICESYASIIGLDEDNAYSKGLAVSISVGEDNTELLEIIQKKYSKQIVFMEASGTIYFSVMSKDV